MVKNHEECKYYLPCGWCDKNNEKCIFEQRGEASKPLANTKDQVSTTKYDYSNVLNKTCVEHDWQCYGVDTDGWMYMCTKCHATKRENYQTFPLVNPVWTNPQTPDINKVGDFPPYTEVTCTSGYINTNKCPEETVESILATNTTTSAQTIANIDNGLNDLTTAQKLVDSLVDSIKTGTVVNSKQQEALDKFKNNVEEEIQEKKDELKDFMSTIKAGKLPKLGKSSFGTQYLDETSRKKKK